MKKKILILTASFGDGHLMASKNIQEALNHLYPKKHNIEIIDFMNTINKTLSKTIEKLYFKSLKYKPNLYHSLYKHFDKPWKVKFLNVLSSPLIISKIKKLLKEKNPDLIISTYPIWNFLISNIWKKKNKHANFATVITDSTFVHQIWLNPQSNFYFVPDKDTKETLLHNHIPSSTIHDFGFPINLNFTQKINKQEIFAKHKLNPRIKTGLLMMNSIPKKDSIKFIEKITSSDLPIQLIIITGKNAALKKEIIKVKHKIKVVTLGWTNKVWQYMKAVDFVITKAGGATVAESIAAQKPIIINQVIMGQEEGNLELIKNHHLGKLIYDDPTEKINPTINFILKHLQSYNKNLKKHSKPDASLKIAQFIDSQLS